VACVWITKLSELRRDYVLEPAFVSFTSTHAAPRSVQNVLTASPADAVPSEQLATTPGTTSCGERLAAPSQWISWSPEVGRKASRWIDADPMADGKLQIMTWDVTVTDTLAMSYLPATYQPLESPVGRSRPAGAGIPVDSSHPHFNYAGFLIALTNSRVYRLLLINLVDISQLALVTSEKQRSYFNAYRWKFSGSTPIASMEAFVLTTLF